MTTTSEGLQTDSRIFVAGHRGLVGSAIVRTLRNAGFENLILATRDDVDLRDQRAVETFFQGQRPEYVFMAAAKVGGILANDSAPADFIRENIQIQTNLIDAAYRHASKKFLFLGSSCIYPKHAAQPMNESALLTGPLEPTNQWYAIAKIAGIKMCQAYRRQYGFNAICAMPTNLYGPEDNFDLETSHVLPALIRKFHEAKSSGAPTVTIWGSGQPRREFLYVDDLADALLFLMKNYEDEEIVNIGTGKDITISGLATLVSDVVGYKGSIAYDASKPDGTPRKLLDVSHLHELGWRAKTDLREGIESTSRWYLENQNRFA